jgi:YidC/Oxa1 family membrane protein insertase
MIKQFFLNFFYRPILNTLIILVSFVPGHDLGSAIILITIIIKLILYPLSKKAIISQKALQDLQPKLEDLKTKHKDNKEELSKAMLGLYKDNNVNPFSSCLPMLVQLPFLIAIFQVFKAGLGEKAVQLSYSFVSIPNNINMVFLGVFDLSKPNIILAVLAGIAQFWQSKMIMGKKKKQASESLANDKEKESDFASVMSSQMLYMGPIFTIMIGLSLPGGLSLYWLISTLLTAFQQLYIIKRDSPETTPTT